ncbi:MAG: hypothetical protein DRI95_06760 [Bacteroidetes bacterium]|nr:MAG: hypothetical protein DRI95_06760 [Bacteroidota bacterium]
MRQKLLICVILILVFFSKSQLKAQIIINEILASNTTTNLDSYSKNFLDWIELANNSNKRISIGGWYLTDKLKKPTKWKIPAYVSIEARGYKLFWADNKNISNHTNFKLNVEGESIYLFNKDSVLVDSVLFPPQVSDISYGRISETNYQWQYFHEPTPNKANPLTGVEKLEFADEPLFSENAGFYKKSFKLELSTNLNFSKMYFTIDGSIPTQSSTEYSEPIDVEKTKVIRARVYTEKKLPGKVVTKSYFLNQSISLPVVSLSCHPKYLWDKNIGIYVEGPKYNPDVWGSANYFKPWERPVNIEFFDINGKAGFNLGAGVKIHGRSTRNYAQKTLAVFARNKYGTDNFQYKLFGDKSQDQIKAFLLRNSGNDWGATMFLDGLVHTLVNGKIDIDAQAYQPSIMFLNGKYWGIHNIREKINEHYIKAKYNVKTKNIDIIEADILVNKLEASHGNMDEYDKMIKFIKNNSLAKKENYNHVKKSIDIDECINYLITQVYIGNKDWPGSNMKFWREKGNSGKWRWILYDTELSFDDYHINGIEHMLIEGSDEKTNPPWSNYLFRKLFESDEFKYEFVQRMAVYLNTIFETNQVLHVMDSLKRNIKPEVKRNLEKWGGIKQKAVPYLITSKNITEWEANVNFIKDFAKNRPGMVRKNIMQQFDVKGTVSLKLKMNDENAGEISIMGYTIQEGKFDGIMFVGVPIRLKAVPRIGYEFVKWKEENYGNECIINLERDKKLTAIFRKME